MDKSPKYTFFKKPDKCPVCQSARIANILYGLPVFSEELGRQLLDGKIVLGGCEIILGDPVWKCIDCGIYLYREKQEV